MQLPAQDVSNPTRWTPWQAVQATLVAAAVATGFTLLYLFRHVVLLLFLAIVLATALKPIVAWVHNRGVKWSLAVFIVFALLGLLALALVVGVLPALLSQASEIIATLPSYYAKLRASLVESSRAPLAQIGDLLPSDLIAWFRGNAKTDDFAKAWSAAGELTATCIRGLLWGSVVCLLGSGWLLQEQRTIQAVLLALSPAHRGEARKLIQQIEDKVGAYVRGQGIVCATMGLLSLGVYSLIGLPGAFFLAVVAGVLEAIPMLGPVLAAVGPLLVAASEDPHKILWVLLAAIVIQQVEGYWLVPRVMDKSVGVNPIMTLLGITGFGALFGLLGAILAIPLAAVLQTVLDRYLFSKQAMEPSQPAGREDVHRLHYQTQELMRDLRLLTRKSKSSLPNSSDEIEESLENIASDLEEYLLAAGDATRSNAPRAVAP